MTLAEGLDAPTNYVTDRTFSPRTRGEMIRKKYMTCVVICFVLYSITTTQSRYPTFGV